MKNLSYFISTLFFLYFLNIQAQNTEFPPSGGGAYETEKTECIAPKNRMETEAMLEANIAALKRQGITGNSGPRIQAFGWPLQAAAGLNWNSYYAINNYVDQNTGSGILDYNCGSRTYNGHWGIDMDTWPFPWYLYENNLVEVVAAEAGIIIGKDDGYNDDHCSCASYDWNGVYLQHSDGSISIYGHMKKHSITAKGIGASVAKGEYLGVVASSGCSTQPHLHFEVYRQLPFTLSNLIEPFQGGCNVFNGESWWGTQKPYREPTLNAALTHDFPPEHGCPGVFEAPHLSNTFLPNSVIYMATYYHDQIVGDVTSFRILRPDNSTWISWSHTSPNTYTKSWWYWSWILPPAGPFGTWKFEVTYRSQTYVHEFDFVSALPVELTNFSARTHERSVALSWQTVSELNNDYFNVEHTQDGIDFTTIGRVRGGGTTQTPQSYTFVHNNPGNATNYYRLKQVDFDGQHEYSKVISVRLKNEDHPEIFPNPTSGILQIEGNFSLNTQIKVRDNTGKLILTTNDLRVDLSAYPTGLYMVEIISENQIMVKKVIKS